MRDKHKYGFLIPYRLTTHKHPVFSKIYKKNSEDNEIIREQMTKEMLRRIGPGHEELKVG